MFKYIKFNRVEIEFTVLEFRGRDEVVKVNYFDKDVVSISSENEADIDVLIAKQSPEIECVEITQNEFKTIVTSSAQLTRIRDVVKAEIAKKYDNPDEIAISKRSDTDVKKVDYNAYIVKCIAIGTELKDTIGY
ncbi:MAG: hypothetical protein QM497_04965 [Sulfurimonas sp.]